ncbi:MAG TPA: DUF1579 family protein [Gemmataceae bacterium]|nr:DUF1579 family protein [Gemmataceae bacterium]
MQNPFLTALLTLTLHSAGMAQQPAPASSAAEQAALAPQDILKKWVGTWDATIESTGRDGKTITSPAKATVRLAYGDRWLITDFDGKFMGAPFTGQEVLGYDPVAKKYIANWIDSAATSFSSGEGTFDPKTNTLILVMNGRDDSTGKMATWRQVDVWKDADHHEWSIRVKGNDDQEKIQMTIRYSRHR